jgi:hypothetical protein
MAQGIAGFSRVQGLTEVQGTQGFRWCKGARDERFAGVTGTQEVKGLY